MKILKKAACLLCVAFAWGGASAAAAAPTVSITASPASVAYGATTLLTWSSTDAGICSLPWGGSATSGTYATGQLFTSTTFGITCYGAGGSAGGWVRVAVNGPPPPPVVTLVASPPVVGFNMPTTLSWTATNAFSCNTPWGSTATSGGYTTGGITYEQTFSITCSGYGGSNSAAVDVKIGAAAPVAAPTVTLTANPMAVVWGSGTTLTWSSTNASSCSTPWGATAAGGTQATGALTSTTTYTVTCTGAGGSKSAAVTVNVGAAPVPAAPDVALTASPLAVPYNGSTTLSWSSTNATACTTPWGAGATGGSYTAAALTASRTYTVSCSGPGGTRSASVSVTVAAAPAPVAPTVALSAAVNPVSANSPATLNWVSTNTTACTTPWGATATSGSYTTPALAATTTYTVSCSGAGGTQSASIVVAVNPAAAPVAAVTVALSANPTSVAYGATTTLTWSSTNATACSTPWGSTATAGAYTTPALLVSTGFSVVCTGRDGKRTTTAVTVAVASAPPAPTVTLVAEPSAVPLNGTARLSWSSTNALSCSTPWGSTATSGSYTTPALTEARGYTVSCSGFGGSGTASTTVTVTATPAPTVTLTATPPSIAYNATTTLRWASTNATTCTTPWGATAPSGIQTTAPLAATTGYQVTCTGIGGTQSASATVVVAAPPAETDPPIVFNATTTAKAGDVVSLQGDNFGDAPVVYLTSAPTVALEIVNRVGTSWLAVQIPPTAQGALVARIRNATGTSAPVKLNGARPLHLDAIQLVPGGAFRIFGRNLLLAGSTPVVQMDGITAAIDLSQSNEHMLAVKAPASLRPTAAVALLVDNGNGSGAAQLDRSIEVAASGSGDPFALGVGWAAGFADLATRTIDAATDARLSQKVVCNGVRDDSPAIQQAIQLAGSLGGGVVRLPAGRCRMAGGMNLQSKVVVQGAGKAATELVYEGNYPVFGVGLDLAGIRNLALTNAGSAVEGPLLKQSTRVFIQNVLVRIGTSSQMYLDGNRNFVVSGSDFVQTGSVSHQGPYIFNGAAGLVFENNTTQWMEGAPTFGRIHDSYVHGNRFTRDATAQHLAGVVHAFTIDFAYRVAVVGNTFDVAGGPITNTARNDGETILSEAGGGQRTENIGSVTSAGSRTLTDTGNTLAADPFGESYAPENYGIAIVAGKGAGQTRRMLSYSWPTATLDATWDVVPDSTSRYASFVWGLEKSLIKDNTLAQNPRGIWLYQAAVRDVDIIGNDISEGGGIYLRSYQNLSAKSFIPIYNVLIANNRVSNTTGRWMSYINAVFVNSDAKAFGIANLGIEMRANRITANVPNKSSQSEEYANTEGFMNMMRVENFGGYESMSMPRMLGTIITGNSCTNCDIAVRVGTGAGGTTILNTQLLNCPVYWSDGPTTVSGERSIGTVVR